MTIAGEQALSMGFRGNLSGATDAEIFRFAAQTGQTDAAIAKISAKLKQLRAESRATLVEAKAARAASFQTRLTRQGLRLQEGGNTVTLGKGGFKMTGSFMRTVTGAILIPQVLSVAARGIAKTVKAFREDSEKYGVQEAAARRGASANALFTAPGRYVYEVGTNITADLARDIGGLNAAEVAEYRERAMDFRQSLLFTLLNPLAGGYFEKTSFEKEEIEKRAKAAHEKFVEAEREFIDSWRPPGVQLRTDADVAALQARMWEMNGASFKEVVREERALGRVKAYAGED